MRRALLLAVSAALASCAGPRVDAPSTAALLAPAQWQQGGAATVGLSGDWWAGFKDSSLDQLIDAALANNVDIHIAAEHVAEASAQVRSARANRLPDLTAGLEGGRDEDVSPIGTPELQNSAVGQLHAMLDPDLFGELRDLERSARAGLVGTVAQQANVRLVVACATATAYINLLAADERLKILRETLMARQESLKFAQRRFESGYATQLDLMQAQAEFHAAEQLIPATELSVTQLEDAISVLTGSTPAPVGRSASLNALSAPDVPVRLPALLLRRRPDIVVAEQQVVAADEALDASRAAFMPHIELTASGGFAYSTLIVANPVKLFQIGGSVLAPIFDSGRLRAREDIAIARRDAAAYAYRKVALQAFREVEDALAAQSRLAQQEEGLAAERDALAKALAIAKSRYRAGYSSYLEQLDSERSLLAVNLGLAQLRAERLGQSIALFQAMGGGWLPELSDEKDEVAAMSSISTAP